MLLAATQCISPPRPEATGRSEGTKAEGVAQEGNNEGGDDGAEEWCDLGVFQEVIRRKDPLGLGFDDLNGLRLLRRLLAWDPRARISAADALKHAYFTTTTTTTTTTTAAAAAAAAAAVAAGGE